MGELFKAANKFMQAEYKKTMEAAREKHESAVTRVTRHAGIAGTLEFLTLVATITALVLLGSAAVRISWVLFQK